jgi:hypothetical protein
MTKQLLTGIALAVLLATPATAAQMVCLPFGCFPVPWFAGPVYGGRGWRPGQFVPPPVVVTPSMEESARLRFGARPQPQPYVPYVPPGYDQPLPQARQPGPPQRNPRQAQAEPDEPMKREIEADILTFCDQHPDEGFCQNLGSWFRKHPD